MLISHQLGEGRPFTSGRTAAYGLRGLGGFGVRQGRQKGVGGWKASHCMGSETHKMRDAASENRDLTIKNGDLTRLTRCAMVNELFTHLHIYIYQYWWTVIHRKIGIYLLKSDVAG